MIVPRGPLNGPQCNQDAVEGARLRRVPTGHLRAYNQLRRLLFLEVDAKIVVVAARAPGAAGQEVPLQAGRCDSRNERRDRREP